MLEWTWPWLGLAALPLPWLLRRLLPAAEERAGAALCLPLAEDFAALSAGRSAVARPPWMLVGAWLLLCLAAARPQWVGEVETLPLSGRDLLLAVDVSGSMAAEDMRIGGRPVNRLQAVQAVVGDFLTRRQGDRVGLLLFGQQAYLMTPLTFDLDSVRYQLDTSSIGLAGRETAMGDAIGLAVKRFREAEAEQRVLILLTDGVNTAGTLEPVRAGELAAVDGVRIHTIGIGGEPRVGGLFGLAFPQSPEIDETSLRQIAERTGGRYFRARNTQELSGIYAEIEQLEPAAKPGERLRPRRDLFHWPLAAAVALALLALLARVAALAVRRERSA
ncbi:MAG: VWA domain-containing protein [Lysobacteraceae bacterium]